MKILMLTDESDMFYHILLEALNNIDATVGHSSMDISDSDISQFDPDVIIHNSEKTDVVKYKDAISIGVNEIDSPSCFSYRNESSKNYIEPFIRITDQDLHDVRYKSDIVYVGSPSLLPDCVSEFQSDSSINFKIIHNTNIPITNYCGACQFENYKKFFNMSKCVLVNKPSPEESKLSFKLLDVIYSGGNPVIHDSDDKFVEDIRDALDGKSFRGDFISKAEIEERYTNYDRMSDILLKIGLNKLSKMVLESKGK
jgi:hypothetical protein